MSVTKAVCLWAQYSILHCLSVLFQLIVLSLCSGIEGSDDEALIAGEQDEELSRWEQEQIRKGINIPQACI